MYVVVIIGILAAIAIPQFSTYRARAMTAEGYALAEVVQQDVVEYLDHTGSFPADNKSCGQPDPTMIKGKYVDSVQVDNGAIIITFNDKVPGDCSGGAMALLPVQPDNNPTGPVSWEHQSCKERGESSAS